MSVTAPTSRGSRYSQLFLDPICRGAKGRKQELDPTLNAIAPGAPSPSSPESSVDDTSVDISAARAAADAADPPVPGRPREYDHDPEEPPSIVREIDGKNSLVNARLARDYYLKLAALVCATWNVLGALLVFAPNTTFWHYLKNSLSVASNLGVFM